MTTFLRQILDQIAPAREKNVSNGVTGAEKMTPMLKLIMLREKTKVLSEGMTQWFEGDTSIIGLGPRKQFWALARRLWACQPNFPTDKTNLEDVSSHNVAIREKV